MTAKPSDHELNARGQLTIRKPCGIVLKIRFITQLPGNWQFVFLAIECGGDVPMAEKPGRQILNGEEIDEALDQMASSIYEFVDDKDNLVLIGIRTGGVYLANRLHEKIKAKTGRDVAVGILDIGLYRDDWTKLSTNPIVRSTELPVSIDERVVVLVDDVFFTGRTVRAAMDALIDFGRPKRIELAVLVDRGHREFPVCANYVGITVSTTLDEVVNVYMREAGEEDRVVVEKK
jgi:pyrimidine operon attenuation protein/uracil phosphoribosyltransferase